MSTWVFAAVSAISSIRSGNEQASALRFQADMARLNAQERSLGYKREELNAQRQANAVMERLQRSNSAVIARSSAMGIMPFSGSPLDLQKYNAEQAGDEWEIAKSNKEMAEMGGRNALLAGEMQRKELKSAASSASMGGWLKALGTLGFTAYGQSQLGGPQQAPAPVRDANIVRYR
jgi:uncharacterized protein involved in type VI secretion and phage assembly